ncbi:hypothetical protein [Hasllibacter sp. MH4015]|uniref:hypothetical protein n=1 Tax=Hasllibacter sp. MH4015 TaxID=2854029 RepID=UPI001CD49D0D|nr:hypothetical protein [Hasllibacter sp. MH4015]
MRIWMSRCAGLALGFLTLFGVNHTAHAQSACPNAADLRGGIALIRDEPFYSNVMTTVNGGLAEARVMQRGATPEVVSTTYSHALTVTRRVGANGVLELVYDDDTAMLDRLAQIGSWTTGVTLLSGGVQQGTGTFTARYVDTVSLPLGDCTYETWHVRTALALEGRDTILQDRYFAPVLRLSLATVSLDAGGNPVSGVVYDRIEAR